MDIYRPLVLLSFEDLLGRVWHLFPLCVWGRPGCLAASKGTRRTGLEAGRGGWVAWGEVCAYSWYGRHSRGPGEKNLLLKRRHFFFTLSPLSYLFILALYFNFFLRLKELLLLRTEKPVGKLVKGSRTLWKENILVGIFKGKSHGSIEKKGMVVKLSSGAFTFRKLR